MRFLEYSDLDFRKIKKDYSQVKHMLETGDFKSADLKKLKGTPYFRAKLNYADRLLLRVVDFQNKKSLLALEIIHNHEYNKSRFLRGSTVQEVDMLPEAMPQEEVLELKYLHPVQPRIHFLKKFVSFDDQQLETFDSYPPVIISGPAGSGKTLILLEKMKQLMGNGLYVTQSSFLVDHARQIYFSDSYQNENQEVDFFGLKQLMESVRIPVGKEMEILAFKRFCSLHGGSSEFAYLTKDPQKLFEEIRGVLTGSGLDAPYLTREQYLGLGVKQTIYLEQDRKKVYSFFEKYLAYLKSDNFYDVNLVAWDYLREVTPCYDFLVVDEIQDLTPIQVLLIMKFLKKPENFIYCGDAHQIVHPNFFSWGKLKNFLFELQDQKIIKVQKQKVLQTITNNYRNARKITDLSNKILLIKNLRFGAIDRESHFLLVANAEREGKVEFYQEQVKLCQDLNKKTKKSVRWAVIVMNEDQKSKVRQILQTPLVFTIHEAKGLEYENVILYNLVSGFEKEFRLISEGITPNEIARFLTEGQNIDFSRQKDKEDKSLEALKFYVNSVYVAITRAVESIIWIESTRKHPFFDLIQAEEQVSESIESLQEDESSMEDWQLEASRLAAQGKLEQADAIKQDILQVAPVPWEVLDHDNYYKLQALALNDQFSKKAKQKLYEFAHIYSITSLFPRLLAAKHARAKTPHQDERYVHNVYNGRYESIKNNDLKRDVRMYGAQFKDEMGRPVIHAATLSCNHQGVRFLMEMGADDEATDMLGIKAISRLVAKWNPTNEIRIPADDFQQTYELLANRPMRFKYRDRMISVMPHKAEYFMMHFMMGHFSRLYLVNQNYLTAGMMEEELQHYPERILPSWRKTRRYWNAILSKNHCEKDWSYGNLFLLRRVQTGIYIINPELEVEQDGNWVKIYDLLRRNFLDLFSVKQNFLPGYLKRLAELESKKVSRTF
jgi:hypothetical protein